MPPRSTEHDDDQDNDEQEEQGGPSLEDRLRHVEDILAADLTAHGERYIGALDHLETLNGHIDARRDSPRAK